MPKLKRKTSTFLKDRFRSGIIPIAKRESYYSLPWADSLQLINENYFLIERSVAECVYTGCRNIWIVGFPHEMVLIKKIIGEFIDFKNKTIPIFYVPVSTFSHSMSYAHALLKGCFAAKYVGKHVSGWVEPTDYWISFPYSIYDFTEFKYLHENFEYRSLLSYSGKTLFNDFLIGGNILKSDVLEAANKFNSLKFENGVRPTDIKMSDIFSFIENNVYFKTQKHEMSFCFDATNWNGLMNFYRSDKVDTLVKPNYLGYIKGYYDSPKFLGED